MISFTNTCKVKVEANDSFCRQLVLINFSSTIQQCFKTRPGQTRSTRRVDPGPGRPGQTRLRPGFIFFIYSYARNDKSRETNHEHCRAEKWEEDLINFKNLSNPFHSQSWRRVDEQKNLESLIAVSILSIRLDEFLIISFFFCLSLCFIFFPLLKLQESITVASILPSVQSVDPSILPSVPSVDPSVLPTDWPIGSSHRYVSLLFYFSKNQQLKCNW